MEPLPYLNAVIHESLRIFPPVAVPLPRVSPGEMVDGYYIPKGVSSRTRGGLGLWSPVGLNDVELQTEVSTSLYAATHSAVNFHDPERFLPERWLDPNNTDKKEASQPLSLGPRNCIGR